MDRGVRPGPRFRETFAGVAAGPVFPPLGEFNLLVSGSPWPMKRAVAPGGKFLIFHGGVGPGWGSSGDGELGSWSVCGPHLELVVGWEGGRGGKGKRRPWGWCSVCWVGSADLQRAVPRRFASEETRPVLRAPSGRDRTGQTKRLLGGTLPRVRSTTGDEGLTPL